MRIIAAGPAVCRKIGVVTGGFGDLDQVVKAGLDTLVTGQAEAFWESDGKNDWVESGRRKDSNCEFGIADLEIRGPESGKRKAEFEKGIEDCGLRIADW